MRRDRLESLLWEQIPFENFVMYGGSITQENLDEIPFETVDELKISRDSDYKINVSCVGHSNRGNTKAIVPVKSSDNLPGTMVSEGKIHICLFKDYHIDLSHCYFNGYVSGLEKTDYKLKCYHVEGCIDASEISAVKEWVINGEKNYLSYCGNAGLEYRGKDSIVGKHGDLTFPKKKTMEDRAYFGRLIHIKYKDTAFDIHFLSDDYGPTWSTNISIAYFQEYGRIPGLKEREIIRDYLSFFTGKKLLYIGETSYDKYGNQCGFVMENPRTYGFDIKKICGDSGRTPINVRFNSGNDYISVLQKYIEPFLYIYEKLDLYSLLTSYWYAKEIAKPFDLPILSGALERLIKKWFKECELNPDILLMEKKDYSNRIKPIINLIDKQFEGSDYLDRMKRSFSGLNKMSVGEQLEHFFKKIELNIRKSEKEAIRARNIPAHGAFGVKEEDYELFIKHSQVYETLINRIILKLINYEGAYIDYGTLGFPEKELDCPIGD